MLTLHDISGKKLSEEDDLQELIEQQVPEVTSSKVNNARFNLELEESMVHEPDDPLEDLLSLTSNLDAFNNDLDGSFFKNITLTDEVEEQLTTEIQEPDDDDDELVIERALNDALHKWQSL